MKPTTEKAFQAQVVGLAKLRGWSVFHPLHSIGSEPGWPDLTLVRGRRLVFAELKSQTGRTTAAQDRWLAELAATEAEVFLWRPADWTQIEAVLAGRDADAA